MNLTNKSPLFLYLSYKPTPLTIIISPSPIDFPLYVINYI